MTVIIIFSLSQMINMGTEVQDVIKKIIAEAQETNAEQENMLFIGTVDESRLKSVIRPNDSTIKTIIATFQTKTFLDNFFLDSEDKPISGIPKVSQIGIVGQPDMGKSLLVQEITLRLASEGHKVAFATSEDIWETQNERFDLQSRMKQKATILGLNWETIKPNLYVLDTLTHADLRSWTNFISVYRALSEIVKIEYFVVDSLTLLEEVRMNLKNRLGELIRYNQLHGITAFYVSQKTTEEAIDQFGMTGGISVGHLLDVAFTIDTKKVWSGDSQMKIDVGAVQGEMLHFIRLLKCRLSRADMRYHKLEITKDGLLKLVK